MKKTNIRCPECQKSMIRRKRMKDFWWGCSGYPHCGVTAHDNKGKPAFIQKEHLVETDFMSQLAFIKGDIDDLRAQILIRLIRSKGMSALSEKHRSMYNRLIEPVRASISFTKCCRCNNTLDSAESLNLGEDRYLCDWCFGYNN